MPERQAAFSPETRWKYSNLAYSIAGQIVEKVSGEPWAGYIHQHTFDPLGTSASSVDKKVAGLTIGYGRRMPDGTREIMPFVDARGMGAPAFRPRPSAALRCGPGVWFPATDTRRALNAE